MIKPIELRLGNRIHKHFEGGPGEEIEVSVRDIFDAQRSLGGKDSRFSFTGIPLTEERLLKAGFEIYSDYDYRNYRLPSNNFFISIWMRSDSPGGFEKEGMAYWGDSYKPIEFVHELQNLFFAINGKELELTPSTV